jgi:small-conductance mechanosensitive channel
MEWVSQLFTDQVLLRNAIATGLLIAVVAILRAVALRLVRRTNWGSDKVLLRWLVQVRSAALLLLLLGFVFIWAEELRTLAISVVAIAVALVVATKELILCLSGSILRATSGSFIVGDRIEIDEIRGDVIDLGPFTTTILEIGPNHRRTGRAVVFPNAMLLDRPVTNETFTEEYVLHTMTVPIGAETDWKEAETRLLEAARAACGPVLDEANRVMTEAARTHGLADFSIEPKAFVLVGDGGELSLSLRIPVRTREKGQVEQSILRAYLEGAD